MDKLQTGIIGLVKSALTGEAVAIPADFDWNAALKTGKKHQILPMLCEGAANSGIDLPPETAQTLETATAVHLFISQNQLYALDEIYKAFDESGIDYMPLKGAELKRIYPKPELRPMSDADILIRQTQYAQIRPVMAALGYTEVLESDHELVWDKKGALHLELHKRLIPSYNKDYYAYYGDGWRFAQEAGGCRYAMRDEDNYVYLFTHYAKHYRDSGIGIRHMTDLFVFAAAHPQLDGAYVEAELEKLQLLTFYKNTRHTLAVWFDGETPDGMSDLITDRIFASGAYGTAAAHLLSAAVKAAGPDSDKNAVRTSVFLHRLFPPYKAMRGRYKCLKAHPALLPLMWILRFLQAPFRRGSIRRNVGQAKVTTPENVIAYREALEAVGLKYNFKE